MVGHLHHKHLLNQSSSESPYNLEALRVPYVS